MEREQSSTGAQGRKQERVGMVGDIQGGYRKDEGQRITFFAREDD